MKSSKDNNGGEILIAEDSPTQREQLEYLLKEHGYVVVATANGKQALEAAKRRRPALIVSDVLMPELDGYGLCKAIKSDKNLKGIPVILVTTLSDPQDVIRGLECGADNFIRKPYEAHYLLSRIEYLLMNLELRKNQKMQMGVEIDLGGQKHFITAERQQILDLLISTYEQAVHINEELKAREKELAHSNQVLNGLYRIAEGLNRATSEQEVAEWALERALELPGVQAGWISLREGESGFRLAAARNLPPALAAPGALEGECHCRRRLLSGELDSVSNMMECERLAEATGDVRGLRYHASIPLWLGNRTVGLMNLTGPRQGLFDEEALKVLYGVGNQVAMALERARLHENLEQLVEQRTAALTAEITERKLAETRFRDLLEFAPDGMVIVDRKGEIVLVNARTEALFGYPREELLGKPLEVLLPEKFRERHVGHRASYFAAPGPRTMGESMDLFGRRKNGIEFPIAVSLGSLKTEGDILVLAAVRDISVRKEQEQRIMRLNRVYAVLSGINTTIVRTRNRQELFDEVCRIAVEHGQFRMAWIGLLDANGEDVTPVAKAGHEEAYLDKIKLTARDGPDTCLMVGRALREKTSVVCNDIATDPQMARWREEALRRGYRSLVVFPLEVGGNVTGLLLLYASEKDFFDTEEMKLLAEVAGDISFALDHLEKEKRLDYLAYYDVLTGLPNRALLYDRLDQRMNGARHDQKVFAVISLNLERFKIVNETLGQHAGDELLRQVARRLRDTLDETDVLASRGGNSFVLVTRRADDAAVIAHILDRTLLGVHGQPFEIEGKELRIEVKAGAAMFPADGGDADTLLRNADAALEKANRSDERYLFYATEFNARVVEKLTLENKLRRALENGDLLLHYQPKIELKQRRISGMEALMRWSDPDTGPISPVMFIPILEETGLILEAGRWALERAVADSRQWQSKGLRVPRISVNVSAIQLRHKDFVDVVKRAFDGGGGMAGGLKLEITESLIMHDIESNIRKLQAVRDMGVEVSVDDFGTGYSSLSYIAKLPINELKIDRAFIINMASNPDDLSIVSTIISLGHSLSLTVVAEGVETEEQANLLRLLKCDEMQGYLFSQAIPAEQIEQLLREEQSPRTT
ncbi:MAG: hypothetical protein CVU17_03135 [Betaproteobacteria bacterium HGW-Betaproteobacteria-11]|nr:MAG: hypothetical protein CVU17_03135 [Betaproteobacteria bacterium HGW-Betaproteobacteria-11]